MPPIAETNISARGGRRVVFVVGRDEIATRAFADDLRAQPALDLLEASASTTAVRTLIATGS
jgi:hypothetical protein